MAFVFPQVEIPMDIDPKDWFDWKWQLKNAIKTKEGLEAVIPLLPQELDFFSSHKSTDFRFQVTPYSLQVLRQRDSHHILRKILIGDFSEYSEQKQAQLDPLNEKNNNPAPRVIHRYSDRALFLVTDYCSVYCRYCTRKHFTAKDQVFPSKSDYEQALDYFKNNKSIKEVILSGGDPLTLSDDRLVKVISDLRSIPHIEIIRIGTRIPVVLPMRVTDELLEKLKAFHPIYIMTHFNHPDELTLESSRALTAFVNHGFPVFNQMVMLNGVNNEAPLVQGLNRRLLYLRTKPYYMFQCDPSQGTDHLRTSIQDSMAIQKELWGHLSGLAMPNLAIDIPSGGGKANLVPNFIEQQNENEFLFTGWDGVTERYINPSLQNLKKPFVDQVYLKEWDEIKAAKKIL
jgi:lysine 2,3-aminomutase